MSHTYRYEKCSLKNKKLYSRKQKQNTTNTRDLPRNKHLWNFTSKSLGHLAVSNVGNALHCKRDVDWVAAGKIIADWLDHKPHQLTASGNKYRYKQIALQHTHTHTHRHSCYTAAYLSIIYNQHANKSTSLHFSLFLLLVPIGKFCCKIKIYTYYTLYIYTVWSTPECIRGEVLTTMRYTNRRLPLPLPVHLYIILLFVDNGLRPCTSKPKNPLRMYVQQSKTYHPASVCVHNYMYICIQYLCECVKQESGS